jgi:hypothetical protein
MRGLRRWGHLMSVSRSVVYLYLFVMALLTAFGAGGYVAGLSAERRVAENDAKIAALRGELMGQIDGMRTGEHVTGTAGLQLGLEEVKRQIQTEMGLFPVKLLRERRASFVELNADDNRGRMNYGTAGYLGNGYFITVKHGVIALNDDLDRPEPRRIVSIKVKYKGKTIPAEVVDAGNAKVEVHPGDWAIIRTQKPVDLPPLRINTSFSYDFAEPVVRLGNDYSKGIILSTGYIGERISNGLVTCLTDGHPGVSGGGVLDQQGSLVGIPVGRMEGDYRFSFILPLRKEMFRNVPVVRIR